MALDINSLHDRWISKNLYYYGRHGITFYFLTWQVDYNEIIIFTSNHGITLLILCMSDGLQRNYIITVKRGIRLYFLKRHLNYNEIILRVIMPLNFISLHIRWIAMKLYYDE